MFYISTGSLRTSSRLFHIGEILYGTFDNKSDSDYKLGEYFEEMKASEFYKIIEDYEESKKEVQ